MKNVALIVHTCDRYQLLYPGFAYFFEKNWPYQDVAISYYFLTEEIDYPSDIFTNIKTGKGEWSDRLLKGLKQIPEDYVIYLQEDMWLNKPVDADTVLKAIEFALSKQANLLKLSSNSVNQTTPEGAYINGLSVGILDNAKSEYLMSHQVSMWKKSFLMEQLKYKEHPWRNERKGTKRLKKLNPVIYHLDLFSENEEQPVNANTVTSMISAYYTVSKNAQLRPYAHPFISEMKLADDAAIREYALKLDHHLKNGLTHDGQGKPRKEDFFKKLKNYLSGR
ncbi:hypothetical protein [Mucilaginibacter paludis]|uniref:Glycosyl transferase family 2 n=1 Tax=Mucilaginibacter paludis DSM 18603 TaxID=714943 RepID=H1XZI3_9SPHI|nr:hypothetical protein [Mucilaginibacter paludis]EHQ26627.1 hypothetical protein Mucpa_2512 [Mucilaginibacter paludis DSM 18603]